MELVEERTHGPADRGIEFTQTEKKRKETQTKNIFKILKTWETITNELRFVSLDSEKERRESGTEQVFAEITLKNTNCGFSKFGKTQTHRFKKLSKSEVG